MRVFMIALTLAVLASPTFAARSSGAEVDGNPCAQSQIDKSVFCGRSGS